ncbi:MAG TPA: hypothetical protein VJN71_06350 [Nitrososphaerales archaeon]|nr:hypothetical protein [Nitrososphaerales archaeon]
MEERASIESDESFLRFHKDSPYVRMTEIATATNGRATSMLAFVKSNPVLAQSKNAVAIVKRGNRYEGKSLNTKISFDRKI